MAKTRWRSPAQPESEQNAVGVVCAPPQEIPPRASGGAMDYIQITVFMGETACKKRMEGI